MTSNPRQEAKNPARSADDVVLEIARLEGPANKANEKFKRAAQRVEEYREAHPELGDLEQKAQEAWQALGEAVVPIQQALAALATLDPNRFSAEMRRLAASGLETG